MIVKVIGNSGKSSLIEWHETEGDKTLRYRSFVRKEDLTHSNGITICDNPHYGSAYGIPWAMLAERIFDYHTVNEFAQTLEQELRRVNVWTYEEAQARPQLVTTAIQSAIALSTRNLISLAKSHLEGDHGNQ